MPLDDRARLEHMIEAAERIAAAAADMRRPELDADWVRAMGLIKGLEVIGEAAARLSPTCRQRHPSVPWEDIVGMRNRLVHGYFDVDLDVIWRAVTEEAPQLAATLRAVLAQESG